VPAPPPAARVPGDLPQPWPETLRLAQLVQVGVALDERLLSYVAGVLEVPEVVIGQRARVSPARAHRSL